MVEASRYDDQNTPANRTDGRPGRVGWFTINQAGQWSLRARARKCWRACWHGGKRSCATTRGSDRSNQDGPRTTA
eukprot:14343242-Alexandrium_andersonii.AAC.1